MLEPLLGSLVREQVLLFIHANGEGYAREISRYFDASLDSVQKQLKRLEKSSVLKCEGKGRTLIYRFNRKYPCLKELCRLLERVSLIKSSETKENISKGICVRRIKRRAEPLRVTVKCYREGE